jgi:hypothetical protein
MRVQVPLRVMRLAVRGPLVQAHRVRKDDAEQAVVAPPSVPCRICAKPLRRDASRSSSPVRVPRAAARASRTARRPRTAPAPRIRSLAHTMRSHRVQLQRRVVTQQAGIDAAAGTGPACGFARHFIRQAVSLVQICPCGCGLLAPIIAPRFSKMVTALTNSSLPRLQRLLGPGVDDLPNASQRHLTERHVVTAVNSRSHGTARSRPAPAAGCPTPVAPAARAAAAPGSHCRIRRSSRSAD